MRDKADTWSVSSAYSFSYHSPCHVLGLICCVPYVMFRHGKGVMKAVHKVNNLIAPEIVAKCMDPVEQEKIDALMLTLDGTENKSSLGANAILGVSMAVCKVGLIIFHSIFLSPIFNK